MSWQRIERNDSDHKVGLLEGRKVSFRKVVVFKPQGCFLTLKENFEQ